MKTARKFTFPEALWAGTEHSLEIAMDAHEAMMAGPFDRATSVATADPTTDVPYNFQLEGNIGIVSISGPLVNNNSPYNMYRGITSYADIRKAIIYAANMPDVKAILLDIDSGGGAVSGCADCGDLISTIDSKVKPVYSYSEGQISSAAYWLGVSARAVYVSQSTVAGSIGIICTHKEYSKALKEAGIAVTVMHAGKYKALVNSVEPLTASAETQIQNQLDAAYAVFAEHVSSALGVSMDTFEAKMGQGREFFGAQAVDVGLAKGVKSFDTMLSFVSKAIDSFEKRDNTYGINQRGNQMTRATLTEQQIAALAAGGSVSAEAAAAALLAASDPVALAAAAVEAEKVAAAALAAAAATQAAAIQAAVLLAGSGGNGKTPDSTLITYLQAQIKEKDLALVAQGVELSGVKSKITSMEASHAGLVKIAAQSVTNMKIGMGQAKADFAAMSPEMLLAEHATTAAAFTAHFKVGGVAAVTLPADKLAATSSEIRTARLQATRFPQHTK